MSNFDPFAPVIRSNAGLINKAGLTQVIHGVPPSKSNCYRIIVIKAKKEGELTKETCPDCGGYKCVPPCGTCGGDGVVGKKKKEHYSLAKTGELREYENNFFIQCHTYRKAMLDGELRFEMDVYYPSKRADLDNSLKVVLDCLQKVGAFKNDNKISEIHTTRHVDPANPRIEFILTQIVDVPCIILKK